MGRWPPPEDFRGKWWRCWLCGGDLTQGEGTTYMEGILFTDPEKQEAAPIAGPVFVHSSCYRAADGDNNQILEHLFFY